MTARGGVERAVRRPLRGAARRRQAAGGAAAGAGDAEGEWHLSPRPLPGLRRPPPATPRTCASRCPRELPALVRLLARRPAGGDGGAQPARPPPRGDGAARALSAFPTRCTCTTTPGSARASPCSAPSAALLRRARRDRRPARPASPRPAARSSEAIGVAALRARSAADLAGARRVVAPSADAAARLRRHFPAPCRRWSAGATPTMPPPPRACRPPAPDHAGSAWSAASARRKATTCCWPAPATPPSATCRWSSCWSATPATTTRCWRPGGCSSPAPTRRREAVDEIRAQRAHLALPAVGLAGNLVLHARRGLAGRARRGGVRYRRAGGARPPHRPRLGVAARPADTSRSTTHCLQCRPRCGP